MLLLFSILLPIMESESQVAWPVFILVMGGVFVIGWIFNALAGRALKATRRRKRIRPAHKIR